LTHTVVYAFDANYLMTSHWRTSWVLWLYEYKHRLEVNKHTMPVTAYWWSEVCLMASGRPTSILHVIALLPEASISTRILD